ncbi:hypothetical protein C2S51_017080 [Perilla frutescens var. frutescens]|nr:hypothetical protein C2S51_017080 [Perilla frutescens var. frutescens]
MDLENPGSVVSSGRWVDLNWHPSGHPKPVAASVADDDTPAAAGFLKVATPTAYLGIKNETRNVKSGALVIVPSKKRGGFGFLRKLLLRRKKASIKNTTSIYLGK